VKEALEYGVVRTLEAGLALLPGPAARLVGRGVGDVAGRLLEARRDHVEASIRAAFPARSDEWVERVATGAYRHFGREIVELLRGGHPDPRDLAEESPAAAPAGEWMEAALSRHGGAIWVTGHVGNWELAGATVAALGFRVAAVVKTQSNPRVDRHLTEMRRALGVEPVPMERAPRRLPRLLRDGWIVALVADQDAGSRGVFVPFLGRPASTFVGPARFSLRCGVPLAFGTLVRDPEAARGYRGIFDPIDRGDVDAGRKGSAVRTAAERALTRRWVGRLEAAVRRFPEQYFWFHRRWKTRPAGEGEGPGRAGDRSGRAGDRSG